MAEQEKTEEKKPAGKGGLIKLVVVGTLAVSGGVATPLFLTKAEPEESLVEAHDVSHVVSGVKIPAAEERSAYLDFDEVVVNLEETRFNRYLKLSFSLQVAESQQAAIEELIEQKKAVLKNWLLCHLADKSIEEIKGKLGANRLRREIHDQFNMVLFDDGIERIQDVLFKDMNIQ